MKRIVVVMFMAFITISMFSQQREHVVQRGEDFSTIAKKYAITEQELMDANPSSKACYAGRKLIIPQHGKPVEREPVTVTPLDIKLLSSEENVLTKGSATTYQVGSALCKKGNYDAAFTYLSKAVESGEPRAYYPLGECYAQKEAKCHDEAKATECFHKATELVKNKYDESYWHSCSNLASRYLEGKGTKKDLSKAKHYTEEFQLYTDPDGREDASKIMRAILAEERAIAEKELAEKRALAAQRLAEKREKAQKQLEAQNLKKQGKSNQGKGNSQVRQTAQASNNKISDDEAFPGYTRMAGGLPMIGETKYWHKSGTYGYCSIRSYQDSSGNQLFYVYPDPIEFTNLSSSYRQNGYRDGWIVLQRVKSNFSLNFSNPYINPNDAIQWSLVDIPGEVLVSMDGNTVQARNGQTYNTPVDKNTVDIIQKKSDELFARAVGAGLIKVDYGESWVEQQLKEEIEELDRKEAERLSRQRSIAEQRADLSRGHRRTVYKSTNVESTPTVWCNVCNKYDKPHTHPVNDGRQP